MENLSIHYFAPSNVNKNCPTCLSEYGYILHFMHGVSNSSRYSLLMSLSVCNQQRNSNKPLKKSVNTRMWANAKRDGRPASVQRRKVWLTPNTGVPCSNAAKTRNPLNFAAVPKLPDRSQPLVGRSSSYCGNMWRRYCA